MSNKTFPYNDFPYKDFPYQDFPYNDFPSAGANPVNTVKRRPSSSSDAGTGGLSHLVFPLFLFAYSPFLYLGYKSTLMITEKLDAGTLVNGILTLFISYLFYQTFAFFKGLMHRLKENGNFTWMLLFAITFAFGCIGPCYIVAKLFNHNFNFHQLGSPVFWILCAPAALILYFFCYKLHVNVAPALGRKGYRLGLNT